MENTFEIHETSVICLNKIIENRYPIGRFWTETTAPPKHYITDAGSHEFLEDESLFIAVDNSTGDAWTEQFTNVKDAITYLNGTD